VRNLAHRLEQRLQDHFRTVPPDNPDAAD
jgi:hypothetical protein